MSNMLVSPLFDDPLPLDRHWVQLEMFPLPPSPSQVFRYLLGMPDPAPELLAPAPLPGEPMYQYMIFPELGEALRAKPERVEAEAPHEIAPETFHEPVAETVYDMSVPPVGAAVFVPPGERGDEPMPRLTEIT